MRYRTRQARQLVVKLLLSKGMQLVNGSLYAKTAQLSKLASLSDVLATQLRCNVDLGGEVNFIGFCYQKRNAV